MTRTMPGGDLRASRPVSTSVSTEAFGTNEGFKIRRDEVVVARQNSGQKETTHQTDQQMERNQVHCVQCVIRWLLGNVHFPTRRYLTMSASSACSESPRKRSRPASTEKEVGQRGAEGTESDKELVYAIAITGEYYACVEFEDSGTPLSELVKVWKEQGGCAGDTIEFPLILPGRDDEEIVEVRVKKLMLAGDWVEAYNMAKLFSDYDSSKTSDVFFVKPDELGMTLEEFKIHWSEKVK